MDSITLGEEATLKVNRKVSQPMFVGFQANRLRYVGFVHKVDIANHFE